MNRTIAVVDDEEDILNLIRIHLEKEQYTVKSFLNGSDFWKWIQSIRVLPDLAVLDIMLPDIDGIEICKRLRSEPALSKLPVIILTAKGDESDKIIGLELGADDYMTKPFSPKELLARVRAILRRTSPVWPGKETKDSIRHIDNITIDFQKFEVWVDSEKVLLTATEFKILDVLTQKRGWVYTRDQILEHLWGHEKYPTERSIDVHINNLRKKLGPIGDKIQNVRGIGYKMEE